MVGRHWPYQLPGWLECSQQHPWNGLSGTSSSVAQACTQEWTESHTYSSRGGTAPTVHSVLKGLRHTAGGHLQGAEQGT